MFRSICLFKKCALNAKIYFNITFNAHKMGDSDNNEIATMSENNADTCKVS